MKNQQIPMPSEEEIKKALEEELVNRNLELSEEHKIFFTKMIKSIGDPSFMMGYSLGFKDAKTILSRARYFLDANAVVVGAPLAIVLAIVTNNIFIGVLVACAATAMLHYTIDQTVEFFRNLLKKKESKEDEQSDSD